MKRTAWALCASLGISLLGSTSLAADKSAIPVTTAQWQPTALEQAHGGVTIEPVRHRGYYGRGYYGGSYYGRGYYGGYNRPHYSYYRPSYGYYRPPYYGYRPYNYGRYYW